MTAFHEARLPARLAFGSTGGVERRTEVVTLGSGHERRSTPWAAGSAALPDRGQSAARWTTWRRR
jgi:uncharacterized protein (TIGR02217 family)